MTVAAAHVLTPPELLDNDLLRLELVHDLAGDAGSLDRGGAEGRAAIAAREQKNLGEDQLITGFPTVDARLNQPYGPDDGVLHTLNLHAAPRGLRHAMIEIRNDFLLDERGQDEWAERLSASLVHAAAH